MRTIGKPFRFIPPFAATVVAAFFIPASIAASPTFCEQPLWQDEFEAATLDRRKWKISKGDGCDQNLCGWGNNERQWYSAANISLADGVLTITGKRQADTEFTSAKITTEGLFARKFGRFEARIKLPSQLGTWPAFWMMPANKTQTWPIEGEIDILEQAGRENEDLQRILGTIHFGKQWPDNVYYSETLLKPQHWGRFHTYRVDWWPDGIRWSVDDKVYGEVTPNDIQPYRWPFNDKPFYLILNLALGGTLGGDIPAAFSQADLSVDYVRVYGLCD